MADKCSNHNLIIVARWQEVVVLVTTFLLFLILLSSMVITIWKICYRSRRKSRKSDQPVEEHRRPASDQPRKAPVDHAYEEIRPHALSEQRRSRTLERSCSFSHATVAGSRQVRSACVQSGDGELAYAQPFDTLPRAPADPTARSSIDKGHTNTIASLQKHSSLARNSLSKRPPSPGEEGVSDTPTPTQEDTSQANEPVTPTPSTGGANKRRLSPSMPVSPTSTLKFEHQSLEIDSDSLVATTSQLGGIDPMLGRCHDDFEEDSQLWFDASDLGVVTQHMDPVPDYAQDYTIEEIEPLTPLAYTTVGVMQLNVAKLWTEKRYTCPRGALSQKSSGYGLGSACEMISMLTWHLRCLVYWHSAIFVYEEKYPQSYVQASMHVHTCKYSYTHAHTNARACTHTRTYAHPHTHTNACMRTHMHPHTHAAHAHEHAHTYARCMLVHHWDTNSASFSE